MFRGASPDSSQVRAILQLPEVGVFAWKNIVVLAWLGDATLDVMSKLGPMFDAHTREVGRVSVVNVVGPSGPLPDESKRQAYKEFLLAHGDKFAHVTFVLERKGFLGSAIRGLVTNLLLLARQQQKMQVVSTLDEVTQWLPAKHAAATGVELDPIEFGRVLVQVRTQAEGLSVATEVEE